MQVLVEEEALRRLVQEEVRAGVAAALAASQAPTGLLTAKQAAERLGMSEAAVRRAQQRRSIPSVKLPTGGVRFDPVELSNWIESAS